MMQRKLLMMAVMLAVTTWALAQNLPSAPVSLNIPRQPLSDALNEFARQARLHVAFYSTESEGFTSPALSGIYTPQEALARLLANTSLTYNVIDAGTVAVMSREKAPAKGRKTDQSAEGAGSVAGPMRLVRSGADDLPAQSGPPSGPQREKSPAPPAEAVVEDSRGIPEILVRGSRSINADIRRSEDDVQPYVVLSGEEIRRSHAVNLEDFLRNRLPMMNAVGAENLSQDPTNFNGGQSSINLRGLGSNQTLILVDGRRLPGVNAGGARYGVNQPDINGVPMASIERIEVLPSTASGIYGGGATGGVINIITRKDYIGMDLSATYGSVFRSDAPRQRFDASAGLTIPGGISVLLAGSHSDSEVLRQGEYDYIERARARLFRNNRSAIDDLSIPPMGYTTNICSATVTASGQASCNNGILVLKNGTSLGSSRTFVPVGYAGLADGGMALVANAGNYNLAPPDDLNSGQRSLVNNPTVDSASANLRRSFGARVDAFVDFSWMDNQGFAAGGTGFAGNVALQPTSPNNPFTTPIFVRYPGVGLDAPMTTRSESTRMAGGLIVRLAGDWTAAGDYAWNRSHYEFATTSPIVVGSAAGLNSGALNIMRDLNLYPLNFSLAPSPNYLYDADTELRNLSLRLSGPVLTLPGGVVRLSALAELQEDEAMDSYEDFGVFNFYPGTSQENRAYYLEAVVPVISQANALHWVRALDVQISARRDTYSTSATDPTVIFVLTRDEELPPLTRFTNEVTATTYTTGLRYQPMEALTLRTSFGTGFLPPAISQIVPNPALSFPITVLDPTRGGQSMTYDVDVRFGGNPGLQPEESESLSAGLIFRPLSLPGLRLSVDYTRIEKSDEIAALSYQDVVNLENRFPGRVTRAANGDITVIDVSAINAASSKLEAYDFQVNYDWSTPRAGNFRVHAIASYQPELSRQLLADLPSTNYVGFTGGLLEWRGNAGITWDSGPWAVSWNAQYFNSYAVYSATSTAGQRASIMRNQGTDQVPRQIYHDLALEYSFDAGGPRGLLEGTEISLSLQNVFDKSPPIIATTSTAYGFYSPYGDPRLRRYSVTLRKHF